jgi:hypothetical protein
MSSWLLVPGIAVCWALVPSRILCRLREALRHCLWSSPRCWGRSPRRHSNGVYKKLMNLWAIRAEGAHGLSRYSQVDAAVWREFVDDLLGLHAEAEAIRARLQGGATRHAKTQGSDSGCRD